MKKEAIRKTAAYLSFAVVVLYIVTGYGITQYRVVEKLSFGLLNKAVSFKIHSYLIIPLLVFLGLHLFFSCNLFKKI